MTLLIALAAALVWAVFARRLGRWHIQSPVVLVAAGVLTGLSTHHQFAVALNSEVAERVAEVILAVLLFVDATEIGRGRLWGDDPGSVARLLLIALPVSLAATVFTGMALFPQLPWVVLLVIACVIIPTDFAPADWILRARGVPRRVRTVLNVESGYNDGIVSPLFLFATILAGVSSQNTPAQALATAVPAAVTAIVVGGVVGAVIGAGLRVADVRGWTTAQSERIAIVVVPVVTYVAVVAVGGNGFVAAFVSGITFSYVLRGGRRRLEEPVVAVARFDLVRDVSSLLALGMWFVFGNVAVLAIVTGIDWRVVVLAALALTLLRIVPVILSFIGSKVPFRQQLLMGVLGPRGTTSIVFGLLAFNRLPNGDQADAALSVMVVVVLASVVLHGAASIVFGRGHPEAGGPAVAAR